ncbi:MAG: (2Fe-2S)-binding protein [Planctomycetota bacterium]|nr:(2Fe-2S)-binding protein [Planctomycetota bacterium]
MNPDDDVCLCFHVSQKKLANFIKREQPQVPSQMSECLGAGTGCHWCVPYLEQMWNQWKDGETPHLDYSPEEYAEQRRAYHKSGQRAPDWPPSAPEDPTPPAE